MPRTGRGGFPDKVFADDAAIMAVNAAAELTEANMPGKQEKVAGPERFAQVWLQFEFGAARSHITPENAEKGSMTMCKERIQTQINHN